MDVGSKDSSVDVGSTVEGLGFRKLSLEYERYIHMCIHRYNDANAQRTVLWVVTRHESHLTCHASHASGSHLYICINIYIYTYTHIYIERKREGDGERKRESKRWLCEMDIGLFG